jgi:hypothetical protein
MKGFMFLKGYKNYNAAFKNNFNFYENAKIIVRHKYIKKRASKVQ